MKLEQLSPENISAILEKKLCLVQASKKYIEELDQKYGVLNNIEMIIRKTVKENSLMILDKTIPLYEYSYLDTICTDEYAFIITDGYYREVYEQIEQVKSINTSDRVIYFFPNNNTEIYLYYKDKYKNQPLDNIIVFRSGPSKDAYIEGMDFYDNARALFEHMVKNGYNEKYELVWFVKDPQKHTDYAGIKNVAFMSFDWAETDNVEQRNAYYRALCLAKYIFFTDAHGFCREARTGQLRIQLWHGCGYKYSKGRNYHEKRYEYYTVVSDIYGNLFQKINGLRKDQILVTGYPKADWLLEKSEIDYLELLNIPPTSKYIFWLPTFRTVSNEGLSYLNEYSDFSETGLPVVDTYEKMNELNSYLKNRNIQLVIKLHPFQKRENIDCGNPSNIFLLDNMELCKHDIMINRLLAYADALISDYSSVTTDYLLLNRPIAFTLDDIEEYKSSRGFMFDNICDWLPGKEIWNMTDFIHFAGMIADGLDFDRNKRQNLRDKLLKYHDGNNSQRVLDMLNI